MLITLLKSIASATNFIHDHLMLISKSIGLHATDKQLHFVVIGLIGLLLFIIVNRLFKFLVRYSIETISFIYTFTVLVVVVFAIEIEQKITGRGNMEFLDIADGLWGFIVTIFIYFILRTTIWFTKSAYSRFTGKLK